MHSERAHSVSPKEHAQFLKSRLFSHFTQYIQEQADFREFLFLISQGATTYSERAHCVAVCCSLLQCVPPLRQAQFPKSRLCSHFTQYI